MGDEELNFTEEEARCWADDPRNQAPKVDSPWHPLVIFFLMMVATAVLIWAAGSRLLEPEGPAPPAAPPAPHASIDLTTGG